MLRIYIYGTELLRMRDVVDAIKILKQRQVQYFENIRQRNSIKLSDIYVVLFYYKTLF